MLNQTQEEQLPFYIEDERLLKDDEIERVV